MKKLVLGCGLSLVILGVAGTVAAYYFVYRPARTFVTSLTDLGSMPELERALTNTAAYTPPPAATLTAAQVQRFMEAQGTVKARLGSRFAELDAKYKALDQQTRGGQRSLGLTELVGAYQDLFGLIADARRAQIDALNAQGFSKHEYDWVRLRVYEAAGLQFTGVDLNDLIGQVKGGTFQLPAQEEKREQAARSVPGANQTLVAPHLDALKEWIPYAIFGL